MALAFKAMQERCHACSLRNKPMKKNKFQLISHTYVEPWFAISIDHVGPLDPPIKGNRFLLTVKDLFSGWTELFPCPSTEAVYVCEILALEIIARYGTPQILVSDNHKAFTSNLFNKFCSDLGIVLKHSAARNPAGNWVERAHQDFKRKTNSLLRQQEQDSLSKFSCDICEENFSSLFRLRQHLDTHDKNELFEATMSPAKETANLIQKELSARHQKNWVATLPAVLWAMRTQYSATRGASPYEIIFGKNPTTSLDLLYGQPVKKAQFSNTADFLRARHRKHEVCETYVKQNLAKQLIRQRQYYADTARTFQQGDWVHLFTPVKTDGVSEKIDTYWSGPWQVHKKLASTTYRIHPIEGKFAGSYKPLTVQVDRIKMYHPTDPVVTPPVNFTGEVPNHDLNLEHYIVDPPDTPAHVKKALEKANQPIQDEGGTLQAKPPWQSHLKDNLTMPNEKGTWPIPQNQSPKSSKKRSRKFTGLPAPPLTRSRAKLLQNESHSIESIFCSVEDQLADDYPIDENTLPKNLQLDEDIHPNDPFIYHRYFLQSGIMKTNLHALYSFHFTDLPTSITRIRK